MSDLRTLLPLVLFMLVPIFIPLGAAAIGAFLDRLRPPALSAAQAAVEQAKSRADQSRAVSPVRIG